MSQGAAGDVPLPSGRMTSGIVRRGDRALRPAGPWSPAVHEYLRHLESAGFDGSPRVLGVDGGFEVLSYLEGDVAADPLIDLAEAAWAFVPLAPLEQLSEAGFSPVPEIGVRLRVFLDAYGLADRRAILPALQRSQLDLEHVAYWPLTAAEAADKLELQARRLRWLDGVLPELGRAL